MNIYTKPLRRAKDNHQTGGRIVNQEFAGMQLLIDDSSTTTGEYHTQTHMEAYLPIKNRQQIPHVGVISPSTGLFLPESVPAVERTLFLRGDQLPSKKTKKSMQRKAATTATQSVDLTTPISSNAQQRS